MAYDSSSPRPLLYTETQFFPLWAVSIPIVMFTLILASGQIQPSPVKIVTLIMLGWFSCLLGFLFASLGKLTTELSATELAVRFGWLPLFRVVVPIHRIQGFEATIYRPLKDHGGWGMRGSVAGGGALNARGNRGVALLLDSGKTLIIGSQKPEALVEALGQVFESQGN